jgi:NAD(P)-dependent dehydrogenase (short-subunit alcohol dehydrogenase family)
MNRSSHLVTGATDGIGFHTALALGRLGARVLVHGRTEAKARAATQALTAQATDAQFVPVWADFEALSEVRALAIQVASLAPALDVLVNNAGVYFKARTETGDGNEMTLQVNHLAPFLLTHLLRAQLEAAPQGRVVNVSSMVHAQAHAGLDDLQSKRAYNGYNAYALSKLLNLYFTHELARRLSTTAVTTSALHPGVITTKLLTSAFGVTGATVEQGALTSVYCATSPALAKVTGRYYADSTETPCAPHANDIELETKLWTLSERLCQLT